MGYYTELSLSVDLKRDTPQQVLQILAYMARQPTPDNPAAYSDAEVPCLPPDEPLFSLPRWDWMLRSGEDIHPSGGPPHCVFQVCGPESWRTSSAQLSVRARIKNYEGQWEAFLLWLAPYIRHGEHGPHYIGHLWGEDDAHPTMLYIDNGKIRMRSARGVPQHLRIGGDEEDT